MPLLGFYFLVDVFWGSFDRLMVAEKYVYNECVQLKRTDSYDINLSHNGV